MGCGKAHISKYFNNEPRYEFINYDHIAFDETVISCDISNTGLKDNSVDICILCVAMFGSNCEDYIKEAYRILKSRAELYIIEPTQRWSEKDANQHIIWGQKSSRLIKKLQDNGFEIYESNIEKFSLFICHKKKVYMKTT